MGVSRMNETECAKRRVLIKRALRLALVQWADGLDLYSPDDEELGSVEARIGERVMVLCRNGENFLFEIEVT